MMRDFKDKFIGCILAAKQRNVPKNQLQKNQIKFKKKYIKMTWTDKKIIAPTILDKFSKNILFH